jgi:hypothetical protein
VIQRIRATHAIQRPVEREANFFVLLLKLITFDQLELTRIREPRQRLRALLTNERIAAAELLGELSRIRTRIHAINRRLLRLRHTHNHQQHKK